MSDKAQGAQVISLVPKREDKGNKGFARARLADVKSKGEAAPQPWHRLKTGNRPLYSRRYKISLGGDIKRIAYMRALLRKEPQETILAALYDACNKFNLLEEIKKQEGGPYAIDAAWHIREVFMQDLPSDGLPPPKRKLVNTYLKEMWTNQWKRTTWVLNASEFERTFWLLATEALKKPLGMRSRVDVLTIIIDQLGIGKLLDEAGIPLT